MGYETIVLNYCYNFHLSLALKTNRVAGPFHNLAGVVGNVRFAYPDLIPEVPLTTRYK